MCEAEIAVPMILEVRLFGGLRISFGARNIVKFESQKSRGLFVYLLLHRDRPFSRELLAGMYWPEQDPHSARRNLRQAVYSLRRDLAKQTDGAWDPLITDHSSIAFNAPACVWVDVEAFQSSLQEAHPGNGHIEPANLAKAVQLYTGNFLAGFHVKDCPEFEDWMLQEQESLKEAAAVALRQMVAFQMEEGGYALGIRYARQLLRLDPLAEDMYRQLMRLYAFSGRRERALSAYRELCEVLKEELGVEPQEETVTDYDAVVAETLPGPAVAAKAQPSGPLIPLIGREKVTAQLRETWHRVRRGHGTTTLLCGAAGTGKTRLLRSFLNEATENRRTLVLRGNFHDHTFPACLGGIAEALRNAVAHEIEVGEALLQLATPPTVADLAVLIPELEELSSEIKSSGSRPLSQDLSQAVASFIKILCRPQEDTHQAVPVILFLDDLQWADLSSLQMLSKIRPLLSDLPVWILAAVRSPSEHDPALPPMIRRWLIDEGIESLNLEPLKTSDVENLVAALVTETDRGRFSRWLLPWAGYPLPVTEHINLLWDQGHLTALPSGELRLTTESTALESSPPRDLIDLYRARYSVLPTSCRRLLMLAAVCGHGFDAALLQEAEDEHETVVETALQLLLEHRLIRHLLGYWADSRWHRDIALWASGPRKGVFAFVHPSIRPALYEFLPQDRRRVLHARVAEALERRLPSGDPNLPPLIASHLLAARQWDRALTHLISAVDRAARLEAFPTARSYLERALDGFKGPEPYANQLQAILAELPKP